MAAATLPHPKVSPLQPFKAPAWTSGTGAVSAQAHAQADDGMMADSWLKLRSNTSPAASGSPIAGLLDGAHSPTIAGTSVSSSSGYRPAAGYGLPDSPLLVPAAPFACTPAQARLLSRLGTVQPEQTGLGPTSALRASSRLSDATASAFGAISSIQSAAAPGLSTFIYLISTLTMPVVIGTNSNPHPFYNIKYNTPVMGGNAHAQCLSMSPPFGWTVQCLIAQCMVCHVEHACQPLLSCSLICRHCQHLSNIYAQHAEHINP